MQDKHLVQIAKAREETENSSSGNIMCGPTGWWGMLVVGEEQGKVRSM